MEVQVLHAKKTDYYAIDGDTFMSLSRVCRAYHTCRKTVYQYTEKYQVSKEDALRMILERKREQFEKAKNVHDEFAKKKAERFQKNQFSFRGKTYSSFREAVNLVCYKYDVYMTTETIRSKAKKFGRSLEGQMELELEKKLKRKEGE